jgi:hypothetical protein
VFESLGSPQWGLPASGQRGVSKRLASVPDPEDTEDLGKALGLVAQPAVELAHAVCVDRR